jgi:hypothetical protein
MRKILIGILLGLSLGISISIFAWVNPSQNPPSGGGVLQTSNTGLTINTSTYFISGNVGIGTTAPGAKLTVRDNSAWLRLEAASDPTGYYTEIRNNWSYSNPFSIVSRGGGTTNTLLSFTDVGGLGLLDDYVRISKTGNVGIGTTAPYDKLHVYGGGLRISNGAFGANGFVFEQDGTSGHLNIRYKNPTAVYSDIMTLGYTGNVGIGTTTPATKLHVFVPGDGAFITVQAMPPTDTSGANAAIQLINREAGGGVHRWVIYQGAVGGGGGTVPNGFDIWEYNNVGCAPGGVCTSRFQIWPNTGNTILVPNGGNVGIGTTAPVNLLHVYAPSGSEKGIYWQDGSNTDLMIYRDIDVGNWALLRSNIGNGIAIIGQPDVVALAVSRTNSNVGIGTTNPGSYKLYVNGSLYASSYYCASDIRLKRDIQELNGTLEKVMNLHPISFVWNEKSEKAGKKDIGISGQEIERYFPELVFKNDDGYISVDYSKLSVVAISAIKEQQKIIEEQTQKIKILEEKIKELESKIEKR